VGVNLKKKGVNQEEVFPVRTRQALTYNVTLRRVPPTIVVVGKQWIPYLLA